MPNVSGSGLRKEVYVRSQGVHGQGQGQRPRDRQDDTSRSQSQIVSPTPSFEDATFEQLEDTYSCIMDDIQAIEDRLGMITDSLRRG